MTKSKSNIKKPAKTSKSVAAHKSRPVHKTPVDTHIHIPLVASVSSLDKPSKSIDRATKIAKSSARAFFWPFRKLWDHKWLIINLIIVVASVLFAISESVRMSTAGQRYDGNVVQMKTVPERDTALVLGAGVLPDGTPTEYLRHRIETAVDLYKAGRVGSLLMSGDNSSSHYDEPTVMKAYAVKIGVPDEDVIVDYAGFSTYDSCYRAQAIFGVRSLSVVTQGYHLPRAVMTCQRLGIDTIGVAAKHTGRDWTASYLIREHISTAKAEIQTFLKPEPTVLGKAE